MTYSISGYDPANPLARTRLNIAREPTAAGRRELIARALAEGRISAEVAREWRKDVERWRLGK